MVEKLIIFWLQFNIDIFSALKKLHIDWQLAKTTE